MIQYLKHNEIDFKKYDACIEAAINSRIYAFSWYLNYVADHWDVLILNDYEVVMPLPWRQKYLIKYVYPPAWTQQLGVFSKNEIHESLVLNFIKAIPKKFKKITIQFNSENKFQHKNGTKRINYILPLNKSYEEIYKGFRKDRKDRIKQVSNENFTVINSSIKELIMIGKNDYSYLKINEENYSILKKLANFLELKNSGFVLGVYNKNNELLGGSFFLKVENRITYLFSVANEQGKNQQVISLIVADIIKQFSSTNYILDFEGSMIKGVASFYKSFGAKDETYHLFEKGLFN